MALPTTHQTTTAGRVGLTILGLILMVAGAVFTGVLWRAYKLTVEVRDNWTVINSVIDISEFEEVRDNMNSAPVYEVKIKYSYTADLKNYDSYRVVRADASQNRKITRSAKDKSAAEALVAKYPLSKPVLCFVNPNDPSQAVLEAGGIGSLYSIWFPLLFVAGGLGMIVNTWLPHHTDKRKIAE